MSKTFSNLLVAAYNSNAENYYAAPASQTSISLQNQLQNTRSLAPNQAGDFRIGGPLSAKINVSCYVCNLNGTDGNTFNFFSGVFADLTGDISTNIYFGGLFFDRCYLDSASVEITPFGPISMSAEFTCLEPPTGEYLLTTAPWPADNLKDHIAYGYYTQITDGTLLSDANRESISYKVACGRTYSYAIGGTQASNVFLDSVEKELSIKATDIGAFINYASYGDIISIKPRNSLGEDMITTGLFMTSAAKIMSQNLSIQEGGNLAGDISMREVIL
jgi:hypothetical protein